MWARMGTRGRVAADAAVALTAVAFTIVMLNEGGLGTAEPGYRALDSLGVVLAFATCAPLLFARRFPGFAWGVIALASLLLIAGDYGFDVPPGPLIAACVLAEAVGGGETPRRRLVAAVSVAAYLPVAFTLMAVVGKSLTSMSSGLFAWAVMFALVWIAGDRSRLRHERIVELEERAHLREQEMAAQRRLAAAEERTRIARELHDSAGHAINVILVQAGAARLLHERDPERSRRAIETIEEVAHSTIADIDRMVRALRSTPTDSGAADATTGGDLPRDATAGASSIVGAPPSSKGTRGASRGTVSTRTANAGAASMSADSEGVDSMSAASMSAKNMRTVNTDAASMSAEKVSTVNTGAANTGGTSTGATGTGATGTGGTGTGRKSTVSFGAGAGAGAGAGLGTGDARTGDAVPHTFPRAGAAVAAGYRVDVTPDDPAPAGTAALEQLVDRHRVSGLQVAATFHGAPRELPSGVAWAAYRILQEGLTNAARHGSGSADVRMSYGPAAVDITVSNPVHSPERGSGRDSLRDPARDRVRPGGGMGIIGMKERAALLDGTLEAGPAGAGTFRLRACLPYAAAAAVGSPT